MFDTRSKAVPKFYLHVTDGKKTYRDPNGLDVTGTRAAEAFAQIVATDLRSDAGYESFYVDVRDQQGNQVAKVFVVPGTDRR
jgi:hypothetical protein